MTGSPAATSCGEPVDRDGLDYVTSGYTHAWCVCGWSLTLPAVAQAYTHLQAHRTTHPMGAPRANENAPTTHEE